MSKTSYLIKTMDVFTGDIHISDTFTFNEFSENIEFLKKPDWCISASIGKILDDDDITELQYYITKTHKGFEPPDRIMGKSCLLTAIQKRHHPVKKYIEKVEWDGTKRIDSWLTNSVGCLDNCYTSQVGSKFLIAAVSRVYNPGCKFDHMLILEGSQGIGKSTLLEELAADWYLDTNFSHKDKDLIDSMRGAFIIEISELSGMNKKDVDWLKSFLSRKVDRVRLAYAARSKNFKRKCVFIGTYNPSGNNMYLRDDTGNRRFWPVECGKTIDIEYVKENKAQLWSEALVRFKEGEKLYLEDSASLEILSEIHGDRELESPTHHTIKEWLKGQVAFVNMEDIMKQCLGIDTRNKMPKDLLSLSTTIGIIMRKLGWRKGTNDKRNIYYNPEHKEQMEGWE